jgi:phosphomannomutase/phosphoglucomutase
MSDSESTDQPGIDPHLFRGYSIRGLADSQLTDPVVSAIGRAVGTYFVQRGGRVVVIGRDARLSSPRISRVLSTALCEAGLVVTDLGMVPTPVHNFATDLYAADAGVMVTASHNPPEYNGFKIRGQETLDATEIQAIYELASAQGEATPDSVGDLLFADPRAAYIERVTAHADIRCPVRVVVDGGHGANGPFVASLLDDLGCHVSTLHCAPDGRFPDRDPDPSAPGATEALSARVQHERAEIGLAFDGDGDRLLVVDERGQRILGDQLLMLLARDVLQAGPAAIVFEILCTRALYDDVVAHGGTPIVTPTGYAFVHAALQANGAALGGEMSGHLFFNRPNFRFDDAILGAVKLLSLISRDGIPLSERIAALPTYCSSPPMRLDCPDAIKTAVVARIRDYFARTWPVDDLDGAHIDFGDGRAVVRASNTQPALSLRFEAHTEARLTAITALVMEQVTVALQETAGD